MSEKLNLEEQRILLEIARNAIERTLEDESGPTPPREERRLNRKNGCFVTLKNGHKLRGCIGNFQSKLPLFKEVAEMAVASAFNDPRFYPLEAQELENIWIEISVLSPLRKINDIDEIQVGVHGLYLEKDFFRGVLLPQVAMEHHWDKKTFLDKTCVKAGLPADAWQSGDTDIYVFSAQIFSERDLE